MQQGRTAREQREGERKPRTDRPGRIGHRGSTWDLTTSHRNGSPNTSNGGSRQLHTDPVARHCPQLGYHGSPRGVVTRLAQERPMTRMSGVHRHRLRSSVSRKSSIQLSTMLLGPGAIGLLRRGRAGALKKDAGQTLDEIGS